MATPKKSTRKPATKAPEKPAKKPAAKKPVAKKPAAKKPAAKKPAAKKPAAPTPPSTQVTLAPVDLAAVPEVTLREEGAALEVTFQAQPAARPEGAALTGHTAFVQALAFSRDGAVLVSGSEDGTVRVWDVASSTCVRTLTQHGGAVNCAAFTPDGARLLTASDDGTVRVWRAGSWELERTLRGHAGYVSEVRPAGEGRAASSGNDGTVRLWDLATGECLRTVRHGSWVNCMDVSPDGRTAVASSTDNVLRAWDLTTGQVARALVDASSLNAGTVMGMIVAAENRSGVGHGSFARHVAWAPDGARFYTSSKELIEWDASTFEERGRVVGDGWDITGFALVPAMREVLAASHDAVRLYDLDTGAVVAEGRWPHGGDVHMAAVSPDGRLAACGSSDGVVGLWELSTLRTGGRAEGHLALPHATAAAPDGSVALTGGADRTARWWELSTGRSRAYAFEEGLFVSPVRFSRDGRFALAMNDKATLAVLDARSGRCLGTARFPDPGNYRPFLKLRELADGRWLVGSVGGPLTLWTVDPVAPSPEVFAGDAGHVTALDVDVDGRVAVTGEYGGDGGPVVVTAWNLGARMTRWQARVAAPGYASEVKVVGARVVVLTSKGALLVLDLDDGAVRSAMKLSNDYLMGLAAVGAAEVFVLGAHPLRVDLERSTVTARIAKDEKSFFHMIDGDRRALLVTPDGVAECDLAAGTRTPIAPVGQVTNVAVSPGGGYVSAAPMSPALTGTVVVLRRPSTEPFTVPSPALPPRSAMTRATLRASDPRRRTTRAPRG